MVRPPAGAPSRYGAGDQAGALNETTPSKVCEAVRLVGQGRVYDLAQVPLFLLALLVVRGVPVLLGLRTNGPRSTLALGLLQATSLPFIVTATQIGVILGHITPATGAGAGLQGPAVGADLPPAGPQPAAPGSACAQPGQRRRRHPCRSHT